MKSSSTLNVGADAIGEPTNCLVEPKYERWLDEALPLSDRMVAGEWPLAEALLCLRFFYTRKIIELAEGNYTLAASRMGISQKNVWTFIRAAREMKSRRWISWRLGENQWAPGSAEVWATRLAMDGCEYREALFIWTRSLMLAALRRCKGKRMAAAALLGVHRNQLLRIPTSPAQTRAVFHRRGARAAA